MKRPLVEINKPAIFRFLRAQKGTRVRKYAGAYPYMSNGVYMESSMAAPVYMYAKNFKKFRKDFSLFIYTLESDQQKVEKHLDKVVKELKREDIVEVLNHVRPFKYVEPELV